MHCCRTNHKHAKRMRESCRSLPKMQHYYAHMVIEQTTQKGRSKNEQQLLQQMHAQIKQPHLQGKKICSTQTCGQQHSMEVSGTLQQTTLVVLSVMHHAESKKYKPTSCKVHPAKSGSLLPPLRYQHFIPCCCRYNLPGNAIFLLPTVHQHKIPNHAMQSLPSPSIKSPCILCCIKPLCPLLIPMPPTPINHLALLIMVQLHLTDHLLFHAACLATASCLCV